MRRFARVLHQHYTIHHYSTTSWKNLGPKGKSNHHDDRLRWTVCQKTGNHIGSVFDVVNNMEKKMGFQYTISFIESLRDVTIDKELKSVIIRSMDDAAEAEKYNRPWTDFKKPYILLKGLLGNGISVNENTYGPILSYMIKKRMTKDFVLLINDLMMNNVDSSSRLSYYQMLMWIKEEAEEKIMELIKNTNCSTREHYLEALGESGREKEITILLDAIDVQGVSTETTERTFRLLGHFGLVSHAKKLIRKFQTMDTDYDEKYVSKLICIYVMNLPSQLENAVRILKGLHRELMATTTQATYESVIKTCTDRKEISLALDVVEIMFKEGLIIDVNLLNTILVTCHYSGYHIWVRRVYSMIEYTKPNEKTLEKMINLFMKINDYAAAKKLLHDSRGFNVSPTTEMYNVILGGFFEKEEFKKGWKFLDEMDDLSVKRNSKTYECIISACNTEDDIVKYDREMQLSGVQPTKGNFEALIKAWARCRSFVNAKKVLLDKSVPAKSLNDLRNTLASTLAHYGQMADAYAEYEEIKRSKQLVKPRTIQMLIQHTHVPNQHDRLIDLLGQVCKYEDWDYSCASIVMYCVEHNLLEEALSLLSARVKRWPKEKKLLIGNIFDEMSQLIVNKLHSNKCDNASLHFGVVLFTKIMREIKVNPSRRSLDFMLHACYLRRHLKYLLDIWKMCKESCRRYYMIDHLCMYKALLACGEPEKAKLLIKHISGDEIDEDVDWIRKECEHYNWKPSGF